MTTRHGNPTDIPNPNGSTHARLNWWKDRNDELQDENAKLRRIIENLMEWEGAGPEWIAERMDAREQATDVLSNATMSCTAPKEKL
jgi:hypothetical protein